MDDTAKRELQERYEAAVEDFVDKVKDDPNIIAVIVCGSLAYDQVWAKSDIDMALIVRDQPKVPHYYCLVEDGITINAELFTRSGFKRGTERLVGGSLPQSYFAKGRIVYSTDDSLYEYFEEFKQLGSRDISLTLLTIGAELVDVWHKCQKWMLVRKNPLYAQYFLLKAADLIAAMELCASGEPPIRESVLTVLEHSPELLAAFYQEPMSRRLSEAEIREAINRMEETLDRHMEQMLRPVLEFMSDQEVKTVTQFLKHFQLPIAGTLQYLADKGVIERVSQPLALTPKSRPSVEEMAYLYIP
ncbi:nucleotidyltransferase [Paenibacillus tengchongensis]|uniref:nucleotidyltransferase n=1 Tax=Paenibacillus tengchongensis TaxID=2608684 RepID=UPI00124C338F|nr:nucleotidyltransferase [Paenibacillus tengchongensis]